MQTKDSYTPTKAMAEEAERGLRWRAEYNRGGTEVGVARARDISNRRNLSSETVARMRSYFARHEVDKQAEGFSPGEDGYPSAGRIAWALWGGDPGQAWAKSIGQQEDAEKMHNLNHAALPFEIKREPDEDGIFSGYASVFGVVDLGMDMVERGAFKKTLETDRKVRMLYQHDMKEVIGVFDEIREDERGLYVKGRILKDVQRGREAMALLKAGAIDSMSIGYKTIEAASEGNGSVRKLLEVDLYEISLVTFPMLPQAKITDVKSVRTIRDFEKSLRDVGWSQKEAKAIAAEGFGGIAARRDDAAATEDEGLHALQQQITRLEELLT